MIDIQEKYKCCGCGACAAVCPRKCIKMVRDNEGFSYPEVDKEQCINCGLCEKTCPIQNPCETHSVLGTYAFLHSDVDTRVKSASGGAFSALAEYVFQKNGTVYGVIYGEDNRIEFSRAKNLDELEKMRSSKYVQSNIFDVLEQIMTDLERSSNPVLVSGTPCQIQAVKKFLRKDYANLITADLVCYGVSSPKVWEKYLREMEAKYNSKIVAYSFRNKKNGYHKNGTYIKFENAANNVTELYFNDESEVNDFMHLAYYSKISLRPACYHCEFKTKERVSDFTMFDCWSLAQFDKDLEDDLGASSIFVHTPKAVEILKELGQFGKLLEVDTEKIIEADGINVLYSTVPHKQRKEFMNDLDTVPIEQMQVKYLQRKEKNKVYLKLKRFGVKLGLLGIARKVKFTITRYLYQKKGQ